MESVGAESPSVTIASRSLTGEAWMVVLSLANMSPIVVGNFGGLIDHVDGGSRVKQDLVRDIALDS